MTIFGRECERRRAWSPTRPTSPVTWSISGRRAATTTTLVASGCQPRQAGQAGRAGQSPREWSAATGSSRARLRENGCERESERARDSPNLRLVRALWRSVFALWNPSSGLFPSNLLINISLGQRAGLPDSLTDFASQYMSSVLRRPIWRSETVLREKEKIALLLPSWQTEDL